MQFSFFDPAKKEYVTRSTEPIHVNVTEAAASAAAPSTPGSIASTLPGAPGGESPPDVRDLRSSGPAAEKMLAGLPFWRIIYYLATLAVVLFILIVGRDLFRQIRARGAAARANRARDQGRSWDRLRAAARQAPTGLSWAEVAQAYETIESVLFDAIDRAFGLGARSLPRSELKRVLTEEKGLSEANWSPIEKILEFSETVRFAGAASKSMETRARTELERWVSLAQKGAETLAQAAAGKKIE
jgi:hypothetical protein